MGLKPSNTGNNCLGLRLNFYKVEVWGGGGDGGMNWDTGIDIYTLL